jgi:TolB-like protein/tetratricopeptide (TPR) repeat protein
MEASEQASSGELDSAQVASFRRYLEQLLASPLFASRRRGQLLRYLVEEKLAGRGAQVTEYGIALDVFERPSSFDTRTEATVRAEMSRLRRALADHYEGAGAADPWRIVLPGRGYEPVLRQQRQQRVEAPVESPPADSPSARDAGPPSVAATPRRRLWVILAAAGLVVAAILAARYGRPGASSISSVAVLPFANLTGDPHNDYLADGVTEQLTDALAQIPTLRVVARTSSFQFKGKNADIREIGRRLDADAVVEGSIQYLDGKLRLTAQVNRTGNGYHILSHSIEGGMRDLGRLENEIVPPLVAVLRPGASVSRRRTPDPQAYDLYLKARAYGGKGTRAAFDAAVPLLNQAIEHDPQFADAYASLASAYASASVTFTAEPMEYAREAKANAAIALRLDPTNARADAAEGLVDGMILLDWKTGERELRRAVELMPQNGPNRISLGLNLLVRGRFDEAIAEDRKAESMDPLFPSVGSAFAYYLARRYDEALAQFSKVRGLHPDLIAIDPFIGAVWQEKHDYEKAMAEYQLALPKIPDQVNARIATLLAAMGKREEARRKLDDLEHPKAGEPPANAFDLAAIYAALGDRDSAFQWLERAYDQRIIWFLKVHPALDPLRGDPRYAELLKKTGL